MPSSHPAFDTLPHLRTYCGVYYLFMRLKRLPFVVRLYVLPNWCKYQALEQSLGIPLLGNDRENTSLEYFCSHYLYISSCGVRSPPNSRILRLFSWETLWNKSGVADWWFKDWSVLLNSRSFPVLPGRTLKFMEETGVTGTELQGYKGWIP